ncbi:hypothetical protein V8E53_001348 [Lactarius tabidus]
MTHDSGYVTGSSAPSFPIGNYIPPRYVQSVIPHYRSTPFTDGVRNISSTQFQPGNDAYWGNSINSSNYDMTETLRVDAPPPRNGGEYAPPQFQYGNFEHGGTNHARVPFVAEPLSNLATNVSHSFPGTSAGSSHQGASPVWKLSNCWVAYEGQDELHLTIVFRKVPSA